MKIAVNPGGCAPPVYVESTPPTQTHLALHTYEPGDNGCLFCGRGINHASHSPAPETNVDGQIAVLEKEIKDLKHDLASARGQAKNATSNLDYWRSQYEAIAAGQPPQPREE